MADNSTQGGTDVIRDKDRAGVKTQIYGTDLNIGGASEVLQTAAALADATANPTVPAWAMHGMLFNGTTWDRMRGDTTNGLDVDVTRLPALPAGTNNIGDVDVLTLPGSPAQEHITAASPNGARLSDGAAFYNTNTAAQLPAALVSGRLDVNVGAAAALTLGAGAATVGTVLNVGDVDHDAVNTAKVVQMGGHASPNTTKPSAVSAAGDRVRQWLDMNGAMVITPRKLATYRAVYRTTTSPFNLSKVFTASSRFQFATIHHAASATKTVRLRSVMVMLFSNTVSNNLEISLVRITAAPVTGNPAITPAIADNADAAAEATCLGLPSTAGTEASVWAQQSFSLGATGAIPTTNPPPVLPRFELLRVAAGDHEAKTPTIRAGVLEGWAVSLFSDGASTVQAKVEIEFTEE